MLASVAACQPGSPMRGLLQLLWGYRYSHGVVYRAVEGWNGKLDVLRPRAAGPARPALIAVHGGGFVGGSKERFLPFLLPFAAEDWVLVTVGYRLAGVAPAPAAVEDVRCALRWLAAHADAYGIDPERLVVAGYSAGGHLALMAAFLPDSALVAGNCPGPTVQPAAVFNWAGITDLEEAVRHPRRAPGPDRWVGGRTDALEYARQLSPLRWVQPTVPPVVTVHGEADASVPHHHAVRLHAALAAAGVRNELVSIPGGGHAYRTAASRAAVERVVRFLRPLVQEGPADAELARPTADR
jgi:acetyl esterase/lipase